MLTWAAPFNICCFLDNHAYKTNSAELHSFECLLAAGATARLTARAGDAFTRLKEWAATQQDWLFGHFAFDLAEVPETPPPAAPIPAAGDTAIIHVPARHSPALPEPIGIH